MCVDSAHAGHDLHRYRKRRIAVAAGRREGDLLADLHLPSLFAGLSTSSARRRLLIDLVVDPESDLGASLSPSEQLPLPQRTPLNAQRDAEQPLDEIVVPSCHQKNAEPTQVPQMFTAVANSL